MRQEPGVSVPQRSARHRGQTEDGGEAADGAATAGPHTGPGLTGINCLQFKTLILQESRKGLGSSSMFLFPPQCTSIVLS